MTAPANEKVAVVVLSLTGAKTVCVYTSADNTVTNEPVFQYCFNMLPASKNNATLWKTWLCFPVLIKTFER